MNIDVKGVIFYVIKLLLIGYVISGIILVVLALMMLKTNVSPGVISGGLLFAYILSCFIGGLLLGKKMEKRKYLWGVLFGLLYFATLFVISLAMKNVTGEMSTETVTIMLLCASGGMLGGMVG
ncbi:MAG: TIGR04086 family membrane protein [Lachnospiraceae bacterium]|nr:TIGR04086 family membrane protein [Lachnospiraceae bacterium]